MQKSILIILFGVFFLFSTGEQIFASSSKSLNSNNKFGSFWSSSSCCNPPVQPQSIGLPTWVKPGEFLDVPLILTNDGAEDIIYTVEIIEDNGTSGWLNVSGLSGIIPSGEFNQDFGTLHLNNGGVQTTETVLVGRLAFHSNAPTTVYLQVSLLVADTVVQPIVDTLNGFLSLSVSSDGGYGNESNGRVTMDYVTNGVDCDTTAVTYLYDASPVILTINGSDTVLSTSIFNANWINDQGFKPVVGQTEPSSGTCMSLFDSKLVNWYKTGTFTTVDSTLAFQQTFYAPLETGSNYILKILKVWSHDGASHTGIRIGEAIDWDIPTDTGSDNVGGIYPLPARNLIYQVGTEYDQDDTTGQTDCMDSDRRFGAIAFLKSTRNGSDESTTPYGAFTARMDSFVYPTNSLVAGQLWEKMGVTGFNVETAVTDQFMVMCYDTSLSISANDTVEFFTSLMTIYNGTLIDLGATADVAKAFAETINSLFYDCDHDYCCIGMRGNVDSDIQGLIDISDLVYLVDFMFTSGPTPACMLEANVNGDANENIDISDLVYLVDYMFTVGPEPASCP